MMLRRWAGLALSVVVLAVLTWRLGTGPLLAGLRAVDLAALLAAAAIVLLTTVGSAWRWSIVSRCLGLRLSVPAAVAAYYRAVFLNLMLPGGVGGDLHRGVKHGRETRDVGRALGAVALERGAGQLVQAVLAISILLVMPSPVRRFMPIVAAAAVALVVGVSLAARLSGRHGGSRETGAINAVVADVREGLLRRQTLPAVITASAVVFVGHVATFLVAARAAGVEAPISRLLPLAIIAVLAMVLPSIGGWGPREGITAWVFSAAGLGAGRGAATAVAYGVLVLAASLPGAVVLVVDALPRRRRSRVRPRRGVSFRPQGAADA